MQHAIGKWKIQRETLVMAGAVLVMLGVLGSVGALNGGTALTASVWDGLKTTLSNMLTSTWVLALAFVALVASVWQIAHGRGYTMLSVVLGLLAVGIIGPTFVTSIATATRVPAVVLLVGTAQQ